MEVKQTLLRLDLWPTWLEIGCVHTEHASPPQARPEVLSTAADGHQGVVTATKLGGLFSSDRTDGVSVASEKLSGEIQEHGYWGGARDRIPLAQTDHLEPSGELSVETDPSTGLVTLRPHGNPCLIRSGQEWTETDGDERRMYLEDVEPVLRAGMDFLRDEGLEIGCRISGISAATTGQACSAHNHHDCTPYVEHRSGPRLPAMGAPRGPVARVPGQAGVAPIT